MPGWARDAYRGHTMPEVERSSSTHRLRSEVRALGQGALHRLRGRDVVLVAAGLTFFAGISLVPFLVLALGLTSWVSSGDTVRSLTTDLAELLPEALGAPEVLDVLVRAGVGLSPLGAVLTLLPLTVYGEGLRRALLRFTTERDSFTGWRGRLAVLPLVVATPAIVFPLLLLARWLTGLTAHGGVGSGVLAVLVTFYAVLLALWLPLAWGFRVVAAGRMDWRAVLVGSSFAAACLSGFLLGFVLFLALPLDLGAPFGGLVPVGGAVAVGLWMFLLHLVLVGCWLLAQALQDRLMARRT